MSEESNRISPGRRAGILMGNRPQQPYAIFLLAVGEERRREEKEREKGVWISREIVGKRKGGVGRGL